MKIIFNSFCKTGYIQALRQSLVRIRLPLQKLFFTALICNSKSQCSFKVIKSILYKEIKDISGCNRLHRDYLLLMLLNDVPPGRAYPPPGYCVPPITGCVPPG